MGLRSAYGKFAKSEEHTDWATKRRNTLKLKALLSVQDEL